MVAQGHILTLQPKPFIICSNRIDIVPNATIYLLQTLLLQGEWSMSSIKVCSIYIVALGTKSSLLLQIINGLDCCVSICPCATISYLAYYYPALRTAKRQHKLT